MANWRERIRNRIRQKLPSALHYDVEADQRLRDVLDFEVPTDDELMAMQARGELPSDEELAGEPDQEARG